MTTLTETQIALLRLGAQDPGGAIDRAQYQDKPAAALSAVLGALRRKGLAQKTDSGCWRITAAGRDAVAPCAAEGDGEADRPATAVNDNLAPGASNASDRSSPDKPCTGQATKRGRVLGLLHGQSGASMAEMTDATGWQAHSVRALLSGLRKDGLSIACERQVEGGSRYRVDMAAQATQ